MVVRRKMRTMSNIATSDLNDKLGAVIDMLRALQKKHGSDAMLTILADGDCHGAGIEAYVESTRMETIKEARERLTREKAFEQRVTKNREEQKQLKDKRDEREYRRLKKKFEKK